MKRFRSEIFCATLIALVWAIHVLAGWRFAGFVDAHWGKSFLSVAEGNVADTRVFVQSREQDAVILFSAAIGLVLAHSLVTRLILKPRQDGKNTRWIIHALFGFISINVWLAAASQTTLFWGLYWQGREDTSALARFQLKRHLLLEYPARRKAVILGNSQARAQIEERQLNEQLAPSLYTGELHFPGSRAYDIFLTHRHLDPAAASVVICYVSEGNFYAGAPSEVAPFFFGFSDLTDAGKLQAFAQVPPRVFGFGLLGDILPAFYLRDALTSRILGTGVSGIRQKQHDQKVKPNLDANARTGAAVYRLNSASDFQKRTFEAFAADCARQNQTLVVIAGQLNPRLGSRINPAIREDMFSFLRELRKRHHNVILVDDCPAQFESDYDDLTHVNKAQQEKFTKFIGDHLRAILPEADRAK